ncbi:MAG: hypothetical protein ACI9N1_002201 [Flavobacteriales bacterium]|jgi:hypothetical protein
MTWEDFKYKYDTILYGLLLGVMTTFIGAFGSKWYFSEQWDYDWSGFFQALSRTDMSGNFLTLMIIPNAVFFYLLYFQWRMDEMAKGIVFCTLLSVGVVLLINGL